MQAGVERVMTENASPLARLPRLAQRVGRHSDGPSLLHFAYVASDNGIRPLCRLMPVVTIIIRPAARFVTVCGGAQKRHKAGTRSGLAVSVAAIRRVLLLVSFHFKVFLVPELRMLY